MRAFRYRFSALSIALLLSFNVWAQSVSASLEEKYARLPLAFEKQAGDRFVARGQGYVVGVEKGKASIGVVANDQAGRTVSIEFAGSRPSRAVAGNALPGKVNYIRRQRSAKVAHRPADVCRVTYPDTYPGIDVAWYGNQQQLEFDLVVKPGADPAAIRLKVGGAGRLFDQTLPAPDLG